MRVIKYTVATAITLIACYSLLVFFSSSETTYECAGTFTSGDAEQSINTFLRLEEYRWWVNFWSEWDGDLWVETPTIAVDWYKFKEVSNDQLRIYDGLSPENLTGDFSKLSGYLFLGMEPLGTIKGTCKETQ